LIDLQEKTQLALCVGIQFPDETEKEALYNLHELERLIDTMGMNCTSSQLVKIKNTNPKFLVGSGKAEELKQTALFEDAEFIIFDTDLSPSQQRNLEEYTGLCVIDRQEVILEIFAQRASTKEAVLQVGLARMEYSLPRLTRAWTHLSRQKGGAKGTRGEGETQLEIDRRIVLEKISKIRRELKQVMKQRTVNRKLRSETPVPSAALVGYTNAGKSTLLNTLTGSEIYAKDQLFATLDPTARRLKLTGGSEILISDTVGFINKLPHKLIDAFRATLEETLYSDVLVHVMDGESEHLLTQYETTMAVLKELGAEEKPILHIINKKDAFIEGGSHLEVLSKEPDAICISALKNEGLDELISALETKLFPHESRMLYLLPGDRHDLVSAARKHGRIFMEEYRDSAILLQAWLPGNLEGRFQRYSHQEEGT
jgi:GTP-binding protein HflX